MKGDMTKKNKQGKAIITEYELCEYDFIPIITEGKK